ncbi:Zinc finger protein 7 [Camellia lanceoleosa]|uniref:Zinc finger protein 7 n=1 Tax=Camellia lanceoleosa TaxID=1840588 RepID=A0ACC0IIT3_9ERIC|nr:Zinc finger protein 7 [Camellia lanceoleosa]
MEAVGGGAEQNPSESNRIFEGPPLNDRDKMNMMKGKGVERGSHSDLPRPPKPAGSHLLLDLKLSNEELNLLKPSKAGSCQASDIESPPWSEKKGMYEKKKKKRTWEEEEAAATRVFSCNFGKREFSTSQAIAGHQNGHKQERALPKWRPFSFGNHLPVSPPYPYYSYCAYPPRPPPLSLPLPLPHYTSLNRSSSSLGNRMESIINKSSFPWSSWAASGQYRFGHEHDDPRLRMMGGFQVHNNNSGGAGGAGAGAVWPPPFFSRFESGSFSSSVSTAATNNATTDDGNKNLLAQLRSSESDPSYDPSGLDLNLKL